MELPSGTSKSHPAFPKYFVLCIAKDCFHYGKQKSGEEKIWSGNSKCCPVSQTASRDGACPCGPTSCTLEKHCLGRMGWVLGSSARMSRGKWSLLCRKRLVERGAHITAHICKFIRETLTREEDKLQRMHKKQWSAEALKPFKWQRIKIPFVCLR